MKPGTSIDIGVVEIDHHRSVGKSETSAPTHIVLHTERGPTYAAGDLENVVVSTSDSGVSTIDWQFDAAQGSRRKQRSKYARKKGKRK